MGRAKKGVAAQFKAASAEKRLSNPANAGVVREFRHDVPLDQITITSNIRRVGVAPENDPMLSELVKSIKQQGIQAPLLLLRGEGSGTGFSVIAGHRRFSAAKIAGLTHVPAWVYLDLTDRQVLELQISENVCRSNLTPSEEAAVYERMRVDLDYTIEEIAQRVGRSAQHICRYLKLFTLPKELLSLVDSGDFNLTKAMLLCSMPKSAIGELTKRNHYLITGNYTTREFEVELNRYFMADLGSNKFDLKKRYRSSDGNIWPPCTECPHKNQLELFEYYAALDSGKCPYVTCFRAKMNIVEGQRKSAAVKKTAQTAEKDGHKYKSMSEEFAAQWREESAVRANENKKRTEYYLDAQLNNRGFHPEDYFIAEISTIEVYSGDQASVTALDELYVKYIGKGTKEIMAAGTYEDIIRATVIKEIFTDCLSIDDHIALVGCDIKEYREEGG